MGKRGMPMKKKLECSIEYYEEIIDENFEDSPMSYIGFLLGQIEAYEAVLKWILEEELKSKDI